MASGVDETVLEIRDYEGEGYQPLVDFAGWRVAILRYLDGIHPDRNASMERHTRTDEVFVLTKGRGVLLMGGSEPKVDEISPQVMETGRIYNVKQNAWHTILLSRDASVLIVESRDTGKENSEYFHLSEDQRALLKGIARREHLD